MTAHQSEEFEASGVWYCRRHSGIVNEDEHRGLCPWWDHADHCDAEHDEGLDDGACSPCQWVELLIPPTPAPRRPTMAEHSDERVKVRWWWGRNRRKSARWAAEMRRQDEQRRIRRSTPTAYVLDIVDNGEHGWKWLVWDYDPDNARLMAGQVEGVLVPHGMKDGYATALDALTAGLGAIRNGGWTGDVVLREKAPSVHCTKETP